MLLHRLFYQLWGLKLLLPAVVCSLFKLFTMWFDRNKTSEEKARMRTGIGSIRFVGVELMAIPLLCTSIAFLLIGYI